MHTTERFLILQVSICNLDYNSWFRKSPFKNIDRHKQIIYEQDVAYK